MLERANQKLMDRRAFLKTIGAGVLGAALWGLGPFKSFTFMDWRFYP